MCKAHKKLWLKQAAQTQTVGVRIPEALKNHLKQASSPPPLSRHRHSAMQAGAAGSHSWLELRFESQCGGTPSYDGRHTCQHDETSGKCIRATNMHEKAWHHEQ